MLDDDRPEVLRKALGPGMGPWQLLRYAAAVIVLASLAGVVTQALPPAQGRAEDLQNREAITTFFALHALAWAGVFVFATRRARRAGQE